MTLPYSIDRCPGYGTADGKPEGECLGCIRRTEGIKDYMAGAFVCWMEAPTEKPCPKRLEAKK